MADIVNLRQARKKKARNAKNRQAEDNRVRFGRTKAEKALTGARNVLDAERHEAGKLEHGDD